MGCLNSKPSSSPSHDTENSVTDSLLDADYSPPTIAPPPVEPIILAANHCKERSPFTWGDEAMPGIGGRKQKWHYLVQGAEDRDWASRTNSNSNTKNKQKQKQKKPAMVPMVMALTYLEPACFPLSLTSNSAALQVFENLCSCSAGSSGLANPYLFPLEAATYLGDRLVL